MHVSVQLVHQPVSHRTTWWLVVAQDDRGGSGVGECSDARGSRQELETVLAALGAALPSDLCIEDLDALDRQLAAAREAVGALGHAHLVNTVVGGLEMAIADLGAQYAGVPLYRFLGGTSSSPVPLYANINRALRQRTPEEFGEVARRAVDAGFRSVKCAPFDDLEGPSDDTAHGLGCLRAVRSAVGPDVSLMVDVHNRLTYTAVLDALSTFEELGIAWLEDSVHIHELHRIEDLAARTAVPLAGGELSWEVDELVRAVNSGLRIVMPDAKHAGGLRRAQRMAAAVAPATVSFHNPSGPVGTLASGHLSLACQDVQLLEYAFGEVPWRADTIEPSEQVAGGTLTVPDASGVGARLASPISSPISAD